MSTKKTTNKKTTTKAKPAAKKTAAKKPAAKKTAVKKPRVGKVNTTAKTATSKKTTAKLKIPMPTARPKPSAVKAALIRRPPSSPHPPQQIVDYLNSDLNQVKVVLEDYAAHLRSLDRRRLNGVGIKLQGFIDRSFEYTVENPEFLPYWLTLDKFREDDEFFISIRAIFDLARQIQELIWNITIEASDIVYTDALEFYASVREAAKRRVDAAESIHTDLSRFFKRRRPQTEEPTEKELMRDASALIHGKRDGKIVIENIKPKLSGGTHKVIDDKFTNSEQYKETEEAEIKE